MAVLMTAPYMQFFDADGEPLNGGKLYTYSAGTLTPKATYTDDTEGTSHANPVILDSSGRATIWINGSYKFRLYDSADNFIRETDNVTSFNVGSSNINSLLPDQSGNAGKVLETDGSNVSWTEILTAPNGLIGGLTLSNNSTDANNDIDVASGICSNSTATEILKLSASITKRLDAAWSVGTNQGGLDTGTKANSTWYHVFVIKRTDTNIVDVLFSTSPTSPTMPSSYTLFRRIGSIRTDGSGNIKAFVQTVDRFEWLSPDATIVGASVSTAALQTLLVPTGVKVRALIQANSPDTDGDSMYFSNPALSDVAVDGGVNAQLSARSSGGRDLVSMEIITNTSGQIRARSSATTSINLNTVGWIDYRE